MKEFVGLETPMVRVFQIGKFRFHAERFLVLVNFGAKYKTKYYTTGTINRAGFLTFERKEEYRINEEFILDNFETLVKQGVVIVSEKNKDK